MYNAIFCTKAVATYKKSKPATNICSSKNNQNEITGKLIVYYLKRGSCFRYDLISYLPNYVFTMVDPSIHLQYHMFFLYSYWHETLSLVSNVYVPFANQMFEYTLRNCWVLDLNNKAFRIYAQNQTFLFGNNHIFLSRQMRQLLDCKNLTTLKNYSQKQVIFILYPSTGM